MSSSRKNRSRIAGGGIQSEPQWDPADFELPPFEPEWLKWVRGIGISALITAGGITAWVVYFGK